MRLDQRPSDLSDSPSLLCISLVLWKREDERRTAGKDHISGNISILLYLAVFKQGNRGKLNLFCPGKYIFYCGKTSSATDLVFSFAMPFPVLNLGSIQFSFCSLSLLLILVHAYKPLIFIWHYLC